MKVLDPADPRVIGRYRVLAEIGAGGMGRVLLGSTADGRLVAIKLMYAPPGEEQQFRERFRREVEASRLVSGAYTAAVMDADPDAPTPWLASVFVRGPSLHDAVAAAGPLPVDSVRRLAAGLAAALLDIHRAGLVHRDLKPSNVLLAVDGPRVIDFGIAQSADGRDRTRLTQTGWLIGSVEYMSPEQIEGGPLSPASDVFCLGCVLVMAATGQSPFAGGSTTRTLYNVVHGQPNLAEVPVELRRIVGPCLAKDPNARPSPAQLLDLVGEIPAAAQAWPAAVQQAIAAQQAEAVDFHNAPAEQTDYLPANPTALATVLHRPGTQYYSQLLPPARKRRRGWLIAAAVLAVLIPLGVILVAVQWNSQQAVAGTGQGAGTSTQGSTSTQSATSTQGTPSPSATTKAAAPNPEFRYSGLQRFAQAYVKAANEDAASDRTDQVKSFTCDGKAGWLYLTIAIPKLHPRAELAEVKLLDDKTGSATVRFSQDTGTPTPEHKLKFEGRGEGWCVKD